LFGVPNRYAELTTNFLEAGEGPLSLIFPTGKVVDSIELTHEFTGKAVQASLVNVGNPTIFVKAESVGMMGH